MREICKVCMSPLGVQDLPTGICRNCQRSGEATLLKICLGVAVATIIVILWGGVC